MNSPYSFQYSRAGDMTCATPGISLPTTGACPSGSYSYTYDGNGLRASSTSPNGAISNFTYNLTSAIPQILTDSTNAYIYGPQGTPLGNAPLEQISISQPTQLPLYLLSGPSGVTNTFDSQGLVGTQSYDPWGNITSSTDMTTPFGYQGAYTDPTGFQYLINRYYDPSTGQFLSVDPLAALTGARYGYSADDPINFRDPLGLGPCWGDICLQFQPGNALKGLANFGAGVANAAAGLVGGHVSAPFCGGTLGASYDIGQGTFWVELGLAGGGPESDLSLADMESSDAVLSKTDALHRAPAWMRSGPGIQSQPWQDYLGNPVTKYTLPGEVNGQQGIYEWIVNNGIITHEFFNPTG